MSKNKVKGKKYFKTISVEVDKKTYQVHFNAFTPMSIIKANVARSTEENLADIGLIIADSLFAGFSDNIKAKTFSELAKGDDLNFVPMIDQSLAWCINYLMELNGIRKK